MEDRASGYLTSVPAEEPFSRIAPTLNLLDLRIEKTLVLRGPGRSLGLYLDAMNVLNVGLARSYIGSSGPYFGVPNAWTDSRTMRLGLRLTFWAHDSRESSTSWATGSGLRTPGRRSDLSREP